LIDDEKAKYLADNNFSFIVSIDGPEHLHNRFRKMKGGRGSFSDTMRGLETLNKHGINRITLRSTYLPVETQVLERVVFLNDLCDQGMASWVSVEPACLTETRCIDNINPEFIFTEENTLALRDELYSVADWFISRVKADKQPRAHVINKTIERLLYKILSPSECGASVGYAAVGPDGRIFGCHREINSEIGHVDKGGIDEELRAKWIDNRSSSRPKCCKCDLQWVCGGGCREHAYGSGGEIKETNEIECLFKQLFFESAVHVMSECTREELEKFVPNPLRQKSKQRRISSPCDSCADKSRCVPGTECVAEKKK